jgi:integrase
MIGLNFALRGGQEHRNLRWKNSQLELKSDTNGVWFLRYTEDTSKTNRGGLKHRKIKPKVVDAYENKENRSRCIVTVYKKYDYHCPSDDKRPDAFYLRPLAKPKGALWYAAQPLGRHKLANVVSDVCKQGGLSGYRTNHSLRASAASRLYDENVDEQLICEVTGHRSNAVRNYKRTTTSLKRKVNSVVQGVQSSDMSTDTKLPVKMPAATATCTTSTSVIEAKGKNITLTLNLNL